MEVEKYEAQAELSTIKSVQLEFVRHSLLTRKVIKAEKQLELIQSQYLPKVQKVRRYLRIIRVNIFIPLFFSSRSYAVFIIYLIYVGITVHSYDCILLIWRADRDSSDKTNGRVSNYFHLVLIC